MLSFTIVGAVVIAVTNAWWGVETQINCTVGEWGEWSRCTTTKDCAMSRFSPMSFSKAPSTWDQGRVQMATMMEEKIKRWEHKPDRRRTLQLEEDIKKRPSDGEKLCVDGLAGDLPCLNVDQLSHVNLDDLGLVVDFEAEPHGVFIGNDCWGWIDPETSDEYALMGTSGGTSFVRITDPSNPVVVAFLPRPKDILTSIWSDIKVVDNHAFIVGEAFKYGMQVFDLTRLRGIQEFEYVKADSHYTEFGHAHNIVANEETKFVYAVGSRLENRSTTCFGGLYALDVSDPLEPRFAGCYGEDGYTHDAQCVVYRGPDERYHGREICFAYNEDTLTIVDVDDKENMHLISKKSYTGVAYCHQGWLTEDHTTILMDDEYDERISKDKRQKTLVWDVRDLEKPVLKRVVRSTLESVDHNQYTLGDLVFQANYETGLRIKHIDQEAYDLHEVGYFDTYPMSDKAIFQGLWSVFPYFPSGNVILSSIELGLFVVRPDYAAMEEAVREHKTFPRQTRFRELLESPPGGACPPLMETIPCETNSVC